MRNLLPLIFLFSFSISAISQNSCIKKFYHEHKKEEGIRNFMIPGFLIWFSTGIANEIVDGEEAKTFLKFAKKFKTIRLLVQNDHNSISKVDYNQLIFDAKKGNYEELISVKEKGKTFHIMGREKKDKLKNLLILVSSEDTFVMMSMKTKIKIKDLNSLINDLMKLEKVREKLKKKEEEERVSPSPIENKDKPIRA
ncbi:MAG: DUF4252 domain-containing protein [Saprospiraceae bacterium]|nr:DUF4252 domain-containing protein [Saprospiraceae bacterium]MDG2419188.1 DUF4252 domain-containing protein [Saprospiraceae bacterium]